MIWHDESCIYPSDLRSLELANTDCMAWTKHYTRLLFLCCIRWLREHRRRWHYEHLDGIAAWAMSLCIACEACL